MYTHISGDPKYQSYSYVLHYTTACERGFVSIDGRSGAAGG